LSSANALSQNSIVFALFKIFSQFARVNTRFEAG
jgi:hypothetical protein